jgi:hypothetical protein
MENLINGFKKNLEFRRDREIENIKNLDREADKLLLFLSCGRFLELELQITELETLIRDSRVYNNPKT